MPSSGETRSRERLLRIGVSSCLLGETVRFDGGHKRDDFLLESLGRWAELIPLCPEVEIGMGVPRESIRLVGDPAAPRLVAPKSGTDHTGSMTRWSREAMQGIRDLGLDGYVLKKDSPSCGLFRVRVYGEEGGARRDGRGIFAAELTRTFPGLPVEEEGRLKDPWLRENFVDHLFTRHRWSRMLEEEPSPAGLVAFHTAHKMTILAHDPEGQRGLGRIVAEAGREAWGPLVERYERELTRAMTTKSTRKKHTNVLHHLMGFLKDLLDRDDKEELLELVEQYRLGQRPLVVPLTLLKHHFRKHPAPDWVYRQVYLDPYPEELMLRNGV